MKRSRLVADVDLTSEAPRPRGRTRPEIVSPRAIPPPPPLEPTKGPIPSDWTDEIPDGGRIWPHCQDAASTATRDKMRGQLVLWGFSLLLVSVAGTFAGIFSNHAEPSLQVLSEVIPLLAAMVVAESRFFFPAHPGGLPTQAVVSSPGRRRRDVRSGRLLGAAAVAGAVAVSAVMAKRYSRKGPPVLRIWRSL